MSQGYLSDQSRLLVDALFHARDQQLLEAFRQRQEQKDRKALFAAVLGMDDEALLDHLVELNVQPEALAAIAIVPLAAVAWADHAVQPEERQAILQAAQSSGVPPQDGRYPVLEYWLTERPGPELLEAWKHYVRALCRQLTPQQIGELKHDLLDGARGVAQAAGGLLGLGNKVSANERAALRELEQAFE